MGRSIAPRTSGCIATSRSRFCRQISPRIAHRSIASSARPARSRRSRTRTFSRSSTTAKRTACSTRSRSSCGARRCARGSLAENAAARGARHDARDRRRRRGRARTRHRASRSQAGEHLHHHRRPPEDSRLRARARRHGRVRGATRKAPAEVLPTEPGIVLGTIGYLAPEQVEARTPTPATDVFALGCILFEMVGGSVPFEARRARTMVAVLHDATPHAEDPRIDAIVQRCSRRVRIAVRRMPASSRR